MAWQVGDDVSTMDVLWSAAARIGQERQQEELRRIHDYLVTKNWLQTAGDLRVARQATDEWHALEIPARLKIAIQQVLDEPQQAYNYSQNCTSYATEPTQYETQWTEEETAAYNAYYYGSEYADQSAAFQAADHTEAAEPEPSTGLESLDVPIVEAHEVIAEEAISYEEPMESVAAMSTSWSCRQCTFLNPMSESFCEMCMDHISLSPDARSIPAESIPQPPSEPIAGEASNEGEHECDTIEEETVHNAVIVSIIPCPQYAPSAPDFDPDDEAISTPTASFEELQVEIKSKDQPPPPPLSSVDFLSLAFQSKSPIKKPMKPEETRPAAGATTIDFV